MEENQNKPKVFYWAGFGVAFWLACEWKFRYMKDNIKKEVIEPIRISQWNEGKPVLVTGILRGDGVVQDDLFNIKKEGLRLLRKVKKYDKGWKDEIGDCPEFLHQEETFTDIKLELDPFDINVNYLKGYPKTFKIAPRALQSQYLKFLNNNGYTVYKDDDSYYITKYKRKSNKYKPTQGDYKVDFEYTPNLVYLTMFGIQSGNTIKHFTHPYLTDPVLIIKPGRHSINDIIDNLPFQNSLLLTTSRIIGPLSIIYSIYFHFKNKT